MQTTIRSGRLRDYDGTEAFAGKGADGTGHGIGLWTEEVADKESDRLSCVIARVVEGEKAPTYQ